MSEKKGFFKRLAQGLSKTRDNIASSFDSIFSGFSGIDEDFYEELEEILIMSDMGIDTTMNIIEDLKKKVKENKIKEPEECRQLLIDSIKDQMRLDDSAYDFIDKKSVVLVIGVNGVGKTTCGIIKRTRKKSITGSCGYIPCWSDRTAQRMVKSCWG